jgi:DNA processing protein
MSTDLAAIRAARATLTLLDPARHRDVHELIASAGPLEALAWLTASHTDNDDRADLLHGVTVAQLHARAARIADAAGTAGARVLIPEDEYWPARLDDLADVAFAAAPSSALCLWVRGNADLPQALTRVVAVVGAHAATPYGVTVAADLGHGLAAAGWSVASTSGYGIDSAALRGALAAGGPAVAVLPGGIDQLHPTGNSDLLHQVIDRGLLVSASPPGTVADRHRHGAARRLLTGLTSGAVLVEAGRRTGALAVLDEAIGRGRPAMVVPGPVTSAMSAGTHQFLRDHRNARVVRDTADVIAELPPTR